MGIGAVLMQMLKLRLDSTGRDPPAVADADGAQVPAYNGAPDRRPGTRQNPGDLSDAQKLFAMGLGHLVLRS